MLESTFRHNKFITGDEDHGVEGSKKPGVKLNREEPAAEEVGNETEAPARIFVVFDADALDSNIEVPRPWISQITKSTSLILEDSEPVW